LFLPSKSSISLTRFASICSLGFLLFNVAGCAENEDNFSPEALSSTSALSTSLPLNDIPHLTSPLAQCSLNEALPAWANYQRQVIDALDEAAVAFYDTYVEQDGRVTYKERYEGGMNSSDDLYEAFKGFSLHTALGGSPEVDKRHRKVWDCITRQFTRYGQIYREFDSNWDWMHHGEGYTSLYPMGLVAPDDALFRERAIRFAAMFTGDDPEAPNYDKELKLMRAVMNGSRGPKMAWNKRDWIPTNANLTYYPLPFEDIPGVDSPTAWINDHPDNDQFGTLVKAMSDRMAKGDVPINLTSTPLIANAYLYTGDEHYIDWVKEYIGSWEALTARNNGITPDNVGLSGEIGEYTGDWWGGYYGWVWPRGGTDIILAQLTAAKVATLLTGGKRWAELPRSQMAVIREQGEIRNGQYKVPIRHDHRGWYHFVDEPAYVYLHLWFMSHEEQDWQHIKRLAEAEINTHGKIIDPDLEWAYFVKGLNPGYPERVLQEDLQNIARKVAFIQNEHGDSETWVDNKWINVEPMITGGLNQLSLGGIPIHRRGEMLHSQVRYFDGQHLQPGLPKDVSALVTRIESDWIEVELVNIHADEARRLVVQGGAYGEHLIENVSFAGLMAETGLTNTEAPEACAKNTSSVEALDTSNSIDIQGIAFSIDLQPRSRSTLRIQLDRYANLPSYSFPWQRTQK